MDWSGSLIDAVLGGRLARKSSLHDVVTDAGEADSWRWREERERKRRKEDERKRRRVGVVGETLSSFLSFSDRHRRYFSHSSQSTLLVHGLVCLALSLIFIFCSFYFYFYYILYLFLYFTFESSDALPASLSSSLTPRMFSQLDNRGLCPILSTITGVRLEVEPTSQPVPDDMSLPCSLDSLYSEIITVSF